MELNVCNIKQMMIIQSISLGSQSQYLSKEQNKYSQYSTLKTQVLPVTAQLSFFIHWLLIEMSIKEYLLFPCIFLHDLQLYLLIIFKNVAFVIFSCFFFISFFIRAIYDLCHTQKRTSLLYKRFWYQVCVYPSLFLAEEI